MALDAPDTHTKYHRDITPEISFAGFQERIKSHFSLANCNLKYAPSEKKVKTPRKL